MRPGKSPRFTLWTLAVVAVLGVGIAVAGWAGSRMFGGSSSAVTIGGPFTLTGTDGQQVTEKNFEGKARAMFFGFTYCPDVCPTTLADAGNWLNALGDKAKDVTFVFVSVDPERDTPSQMKDYLSAFDPRIVGLTGSMDEIKKIERNYRVYARKVKTGEGPDDYTMDHSASVLLFDRDGNFSGIVDYTEPESETIEKLKKLVG